MKKLLTTATAFALLAGAAQAEGKLSVYHWFEYIPQELVDKFTAETGIEVTIDTYDSNESMLASLKAWRNKVSTGSRTCAPSRCKPSGTQAMSRPMTRVKSNFA